MPKKVVKLTNVNMTANCIYLEGWRSEYKNCVFSIDIKDIEDLYMYTCDISIISGSFEKVKFIERSFIDGTTFENVTFKECEFENIDLRWCTFDNCQFINCSGILKYARASTWKKNCKFVNSSISVEQIDEYLYINSKRYGVYTEIRDIAKAFSIKEKELKKKDFWTLAVGIVDKGNCHIKMDNWPDYEVTITSEGDNYTVERKLVTDIWGKKVDNSKVTFYTRESSIYGINLILYNDRKYINELIREDKFKPSTFMES